MATHKPKPQTSSFAALAAPFAVASAEAPGAPAEFRLLPAGAFRSGDTRPAECAAWLLDEAAATRLITAANARASDYVIDFEHQTLRSVANGQPAPAAGWFKALEWRADGLYAVDVRWTEAAAAMIAAGQYRYISPVFAYDSQTGAVTAIAHAGLVNAPGLDGLTDLSALSALAALAASLSPVPPTQEPLMDEILEQLRWMLNLPLSATAEEIGAELDKLKARIVGADAASLSALLDSQNASVAALSAQVAAPDPAKYVALAVADGLRGEIAALSAEVTAFRQEKTAALVAGALAEGRITPAEESWAQSYAAKDAEGFAALLAARVPLVALGATQTGGKPPAGATGTAALSDTDALAARLLGQSSEFFTKHKE